MLCAGEPMAEENDEKVGFFDYGSYFKVRSVCFDIVRQVRVRVLW
jgi:hypothetical protein